jgi:hypothetical protein
MRRGDVKAKPEVQCPVPGKPSALPSGYTDTDFAPGTSPFALVHRRRRNPAAPALRVQRKT